MYQTKSYQPQTLKHHTKALWLSDLHLDKAPSSRLHPIHKKIKNTPSDIVIITGDISSSKCLPKRLEALADSAYPRPLFIVLGNHDYYNSDIKTVDTSIKKLASQVANLHVIGEGDIIPINTNTCLIGHRGWADARAGYGLRTHAISPDRNAIHDFNSLSHEQSLRKMRELGKESANAIRANLPLALSKYEHVVVMTHVPPFSRAVKYLGKICSPLHLPHYTNLSMGLAIWGIAQAFIHRKITVLAGHTHSAGFAQIQPNISMRIADARPGRPAFKLLDL